MTYKLEFKAKFVKEFKKFDKPLQNRILNSLQKLTVDFNSCDVKKLRDINLFRLRVGDYRILFNVKKKLNDIIVIEVIHIMHRKDIYKKR